MRIKALNKLKNIVKNKAMLNSKETFTVPVAEFSLEDLQKIKNNNSLFNTIFKLKEYDLIISENVFNKLDKEYIRKILINICQILSIKDETDTQKEKENINYNNNNNNKDIKNEIIIEKATREKKLQTFFDKYFNKIIKILKAKKDFSLLEIFAESVLRYIPQKEIPLEIVKNF